MVARLGDQPAEVPLPWPAAGALIAVDAAVAAVGDSLLTRQRTWAGRVKALLLFSAMVFPAAHLRTRLERRQAVAVGYRTMSELQVVPWPRIGTGLALLLPLLNRLTGRRLPWIAEGWRRHLALALLTDFERRLILRRATAAIRAEDYSA